MCLWGAGSEFIPDGYRISMEHLKEVVRKREERKWYTAEMEREINSRKDILLVPTQSMLWLSIQPERYESENALTRIEDILSAWWNPIRDSLTSISGSDLIWQMDTDYTLSCDVCCRQWSVGCCHFVFRNKTSSPKFPLSCTWSSRSGRICGLSSGCILIDFAVILAMLKTL